MFSKRLALATILITFTLLLWGGVVHNTESSLACPDWPLCYGQFFPKMEGSILIEHGHRLLASLVGLLTIFLVVATKKEFQNTKTSLPFRLSCLALVMVIFQGVLGGITVIYKLPTIVSTSHLGLSLIFFSTLVLIHHESSRDFTFKKLASQMSEPIMSFLSGSISKLRLGIKLAVIFVYFQIILGAFVRHSGAGVACGVGFKNAFLCFDTQKWETILFPTAPEAQLHMFHRFMAIFVGLWVLYTAFNVVKLMNKSELNHFTTRKSLKVFALLSALTVLVQISLGVLTVTKALDPIPTTAHLGGAALLLIFLWKLNLILKDVESYLHPEGVHTFLGDLINLTKPKLSALVMVTVLAGMLLSPEHINFFKAVWVLILIALVVMGAGVLNCFIERDIDAKMLRTMNRSLPSGRMLPRTALYFGLGMIFISIPMLFLTVNFATGFLSLLAFALYIFAYTPLKKKSELAVYVGAIPGAIPPILGRASVTGHIDSMGWALFFILLIWQLPHFLAISLFHSKDYDAADLKVYPNLHGQKKTKFYIVFFTMLLILVALLPSYLGDAAGYYQKASLVLGAAFLILSLFGLKRFRSEEEEKRWAKTYFWGSIVYLPALLCAMLFLNR